MSHRSRSDTVRRRLAYEAARIMAEQGLGGFERARRKAAERAGVSNRRFWPSNEEIQDALLAQRRIFEGEGQAQVLTRRRGEALEAMRSFSRFRPRLVGAVLDGTADERHPVRLHLFAERPEDVLFSLMENRIPWQEREEWLRFGSGSRRAVALFAFYAGETPFELVVLPPSALRSPPLDPVTDRPERGADAGEVQRLLDEGGMDLASCG